MGWRQDEGLGAGMGARGRIGQVGWEEVGTGLGARDGAALGFKGALKLVQAL